MTVNKLQEKITISPAGELYQDWMEDILQRWWESTTIITRGRIFNVKELPGLIAFYQHNPIGLLTYHIENSDCEIVSLNSALDGIGVGTELLSAVKDIAIQAGCRRIHLITTNDNLGAIRFYQKRGYRLTAIHPNAMDRSRALKPEIPIIGIDGIPIRDEIEMELRL